MAEALSAYQIWEASVCMAEAHGVRGFPPTLHITSRIVRITPDWGAKRLVINTAPPPLIQRRSTINPESTLVVPQNVNLVKYCILYTVLTNILKWFLMIRALAERK